MQLLRRHLRSLTIGALACHAAWIPALVPRDCCARHLAPTAAGPACHDDESPAEGHTECAEAGHLAHHPTDPDACALLPACAGPLATLNVLLSQTGVTVDRIALHREQTLQAASGTPPARTNDRRTPPDTLPPRA